jgi:hypothetical protein
MLKVESTPIGTWKVIMISFHVEGLLFIKLKIKKGGGGGGGGRSFNWVPYFNDVGLFSKLWDVGFDSMYPPFDGTSMESGVTFHLHNAATMQYGVMDLAKGD